MLDRALCTLQSKNSIRRTIHWIDSVTQQAIAEAAWRLGYAIVSVKFRQR